MIGRLDKRVTIKQSTEAHVRGQIKTTWSTLATVWAQVLPGTSREAYRAAQTEGSLQYLVRIRNRNDVTGKDRVLWNDRLMEILGPPVQVVVGGTRLLELKCAEVEDVD